MSRTDDASEPLLERQFEDISKETQRFWSGFSDFALRDNVLEVALGLIVLEMTKKEQLNGRIAAAFTNVVTSFTSDILLPFVSLLPFFNKQLDEKFTVLRPGPNYDDGSVRGYNTLQQAVDDGAVVFAYGSFLDNLVNFLGIGISLYLLARLYVWVSHDASIMHETVKCKFCRKSISVKAKRCANCTSWQDGRERP